MLQSYAWFHVQSFDPITQLLHELADATITKQHRLGGLNNRNKSSQLWRLDAHSQELAELVSAEVALLGL